MNQRDLSEILVMSAGLSKTTIGDTDVLAWWELPEIRKLDAAKAKEAVRIYYQQNEKPMKPVHLIQYAKTVGGNTTHYGEPGEILCPDCRGVHYPHEDCSVLVPMPANFREQVKALTGVDPGELFRLPDDVEDLSGF